MGVFSDKELEGFNEADLANKRIMRDARERYDLALQAGDQYSLAEAAQAYATAENHQHYLYNSVQREADRRAQVNTAPAPMSEAEDLQRHIWTTAVEVQPGQVPNADGWNRYLTNRWKIGEAVAQGRLTAEQGEKSTQSHVPGRTISRQGLQVVMPRHDHRNALT
jgi:hypothetical protein